MCLKTPITPSTGAYWENIRRLKQELEQAEAVVIGAGAGLSAAAGFAYDGERFRQHFSDFEQKYGFHDMYTGGFYPFDTPEEYWAYWSRYIGINRYQNPPKPVYTDLLRLVKDKEYFVITTNVDHCFQKAGFDTQRLFYTQGDYGLFQCSEPCHAITYDNKKAVYSMIHEQRDMKIPTKHIPRCPKCGKPLVMNLRVDDRFVEDAGWHRAAERYKTFLQSRQGQTIVLWELGVGYNTPGIIKYPFWQMTAQNARATYACINVNEIVCPPDIQSRSIGIHADVARVLQDMR